LNSSAIHPNF